MIKRFDGTNWVDTSTHRRWNGSAWVDCSSAKRFDGANWIEFMMTFKTFKDNFSHIRIYHHSVIQVGDYKFENKNGYVYYWAESTSYDTSISGTSTSGAALRFKAVMKDGKEYEINRELISLLDCNIYLMPRWSMQNIGTYAHNSAGVRYFGKTYTRNATGDEVKNKYIGTYLPDNVNEIELSCSVHSSFASAGASILIYTNDATIDFHLLNNLTGEKFNLGTGFTFN